VIEVRRIAGADPLDFEVVVREGSGETRHLVTMSQVMSQRLTAGKHTPERCLEAAFRFLPLFCSTASRKNRSSVTSI
jgi:hypothetical protein